LRRPQSGHTYFTLKDDKSQIRCVFFRPYGIRNVRFELEDGMKILCRARLSAYLPRGEYQLIVESLEPQGTGALQKAFEQLKARLAAEGLFDAAAKKPLPFLPARIGVVTSPTGAVIRDILNITRRRFPSIDILIAPARVQGEGAAAEIITSLRNLQLSGLVDIIIIARGGGSLEDLAAFNDEELAREIFRSSIPVVSAVGHETDFTICDFVADLRAPTPSAAAELVVPCRSDLLDTIYSLRQRLIAAQQRFFEDQKNALDTVRARFRDPRMFLADYSIKLDDLHDRLRNYFTHHTQALGHELRQLELRLQNRSPRRLIDEKRFLLDTMHKDLLGGWKRYHDGYTRRLNNDAALLASLNPLAVLQRGYSITRRESGDDIVRDASRLTLGERVRIQLAQGSFRASVEKILGE
jgi:exodeoxyribonuclease VII large subunit